MPKQSLFRLIKRWKQYEPKDNRTKVLKLTRGIYILYQKISENAYEVVYIGVAGLGKTGGGAINNRLKRHNQRIKTWTHFSYFEVHDNVASEDIREIEALLLGIFQHDSRITLANKQKGSTKLRLLKNASQWNDVQSGASKKTRT